MTYGSVGPYGSDPVYGGVTDPIPPTPHEGCVCGDGWRFETTDLATGQLKGLLHPVSVSWEEKNSSPGSGQMVIQSRDYTPADVWPHDTGVYISQIVGGERVGRWAGVIEQYDADSGGATTVGMVGIDGYLFGRNLADTFGGVQRVFTNRPQTEIAKELVDFTTADGISLVAVAGPSDRLRDRTYQSWELKNIGEAVKELTEVADGVEYRLEHRYNNGAWLTTIVFLDQIGLDRGVHLRGDIDGSTYGVTVDAKDHATWVYAVGQGEESAQLLSVAYDEAGIYPKYDAVPAWKDVEQKTTLDSHAVGHVIDHRDPVATPSMVVPGLVPAPEMTQVGDRLRVSFEYGLASYDDHARVLSIGWTLQAGSPVMRAFSFTPERRAADSVRTGVVAPPSPPVVPGPSDPTAVSTVKDARAVNVTGMTHSKET